MDQISKISPEEGDIIVYKVCKPLTQDEHRELRHYLENIFTHNKVLIVVGDVDIKALTLTKDHVLHVKLPDTALKSRFTTISKNLKKIFPNNEVLVSDNATEIDTYIKDE